MPITLKQSKVIQISKTDRLRARLVLALGQAQVGTSQVSVDELIALRDGTLSNESRERLLRLLDSCPDCYEEWLALNRFLDDEESPFATGPWLRVTRWWSFATARNLSAAAAVVVIAVMLTLLLRPETDLGTDIDRAYELAIKQSLLPPEPTPLIATGLPGYAFAGTGDVVMARTAFAAGIWRGNHELQQDVSAAYPGPLLPSGVPTASLPNDPWQKTRWSVYSETARWLVLVTQACRGPGARHSAFWHYQEPVVHRISARISGLALEHDFAKVVSGRLGQIDDAVGELARGARADRQCTRIEREVQSILDVAGNPAE